MISFPYLKEEIRRILKACQDYNLGTFCSWITNNLLMSKFFRIIFFGINFILFYLYRILLAILFLNFSFANGDLRLIFYLLPVSFIIWILSFFFYYHMWSVEGNLNYLKACMDVFPVVNANYKLDSRFIKINPLDCRFKITAFGYSEGFTNDHYPRLVGFWFDLASFDLSYQKYKKFTSILSAFIISIYTFCWFYLSYKFFLSGDSLVILNTEPFLWGLLKFTKRSFHTTRPLYAPWDARTVIENVMNPLKIATANKYSPGHMVYGELESNGDFKAYGMLTSKSQVSDPNIIIKKLCSTKIDGSCGDQYYIPFDNPLTLKKGLFSTFSSGISSQLFARVDITTLLDSEKK
jgi:hypothetical protein